MANKKIKNDLDTVHIGVPVLVFVGLFFLTLSFVLSYLTFFNEPEVQKDFSGRGAGGALAMGVMCMYVALKKKQRKKGNNLTNRTD